MLIKAINFLEADITSLKDQTAREIKDIDACLSQPAAKSRLRPRIKMNGGGVAFSIIWQKLVFYSYATRRAILKPINKGPSHQVPKTRLMVRCRNCESWEREYLWEKELGFARVRKQVDLLSRVVNVLKQYDAMEPQEAPEPSESPNICLEEIVETLTCAFRSLKERTRREVTEVIGRLAESGRTELRPRVGAGKWSGFTVEWVKPNGRDLEKGQQVERQIPREGKYSIRRSRLLAHCRGCEDALQEYIWEKESRFAQVRKQVDLLTQAITVLKQYAKEAEGGGNV